MPNERGRNGNGTPWSKNAMDDTIEHRDLDTVVRMKCIDVTMWLLEQDGSDTHALDDVLNTAMQLEHWITNGGTVMFDCVDSLRKFVRGG